MTSSGAMAPRVALVHDWLTGMRGGEKVLESIAELFPDAPIYTLLHVEGSVSPALERHPVHTSFVQRLPFVDRRYRSYLPLFPAAVEDFDLSGYDLVVSTSHCVAKGAIPAPGALHVCYCHSPMRYAWDQEHAYFPRRRGPVARLRNLALTALRTWDAATVPRVDRFVANSRFVAERIRRFYGRDADVVPPPVDVERFAPRDPRRDDDAVPYAVAVSALVPYKRVEDAIAACEASGLELRVVGDGPERRRLESLAGEQTRLLGRVEDDELETLLRGAAVFVQPGVEDFGIAAVEALAAGVPVVAAGRGGVLDIVEDGVHGILYPPGDGVDGLRRAIDKWRQMSFNVLELTGRARSFRPTCFQERFRAIIEGLPARMFSTNRPSEELESISS